MMLFRMILSHPEYPQTTPYSTFCVAFRVFLTYEDRGLKFVFHRLIVAAHSPRMSNSPWKGCGQSHMTRFKFWNGRS